MLAKLFFHFQNLYHRAALREVQRRFHQNCQSSLLSQPISCRMIQRLPPVRSFSRFSAASYTRSRPLGRKPPANYQRFNPNTSSAQWSFKRWAARPTFYIEVGGMAIFIGAFYSYNLEEVPFSGRRRFNIISSAYEDQMGKEQYEQLLIQYRDRILPEWDHRSVQVRRVLERLIPASGLGDKDWKVHVVLNEEPNAFVLPTGKVFLNTGILPICDGDQGLAAVLGHEIGHNIAHHAAEGMSQVFFIVLAAWILEWTIGLPGSMSQVVLDFAFHKPGSRRQESEADYIGLMMMAQSCFNPESAVEFWSRMEQKERKDAAPPQLLSTHPSTHTRRMDMQQWLPKAIEKRNESGCGSFARGIEDFRRTVQSQQFDR